MKRILYLSYHYEPDLSAGSFRNAALANALAQKTIGNYSMYLLCSQPNRYSNLKEKSEPYEAHGNLHIYRVEVPQHGNGFLRQLIAFRAYWKFVQAKAKELDPDCVFASSSKLFTAYLAYRIARQKKRLLYLDVRDLFAENLKEFIKWPVVNRMASWFVKTFFEIPCLQYAQHISINSEGFRSSIPKGYKGQVHFYPNGIDADFLNWRQTEGLDLNKKTVCYAGNIGEGQGLHKIVPGLAKALEKTHRFILIGSGSAFRKLQKSLIEMNITNVECIAPVKRKTLLEYYRNSHYLFLHLNDFDSFKKVLPSKIFEYASGNIPIVAGVAGTARHFIETEVQTNVFLFDPCDVHAAIRIFEGSHYTLEARPEFVKKYNREMLTNRMADSIVEAFGDAE